MNITPVEMNRALEDRPYVVMGPEALVFALFYEADLRDPSPESKTWRLAFECVGAPHPSHWIVFSRGWGYGVPQLDCMWVCYLPRAFSPTREAALAAAKELRIEKTQPYLSPTPPDSPGRAGV